MRQFSGPSRSSVRSSACGRSGWTSPGCCCRCTPTRPGTTGRTPRRACRRPVTPHEPRPSRRRTANAASTPTAPGRGATQPADAVSCRPSCSCWGEGRRRARRACAPSTRASTRSGCDPNVPAWVRRAGRQDATRRRGSTADRDAMLAEHPLSVLPCYEPPRHRAAAPRASVRRSALLALGCCRRRRCVASPALWGPWLVVAALAACSPRGSRRVARHRSLVPPRCRGRRARLADRADVRVSGWLLRLPVLRGLLVAAAATCSRCGRGTSRSCGPARERAFCGVRA